MLLVVMISVVTLSAIMLSITMLSFVMLSVAMLSVFIVSVNMLIIVMLSVVNDECRYAVRHCADFCYAECHYAECHYKCPGALTGSPSNGFLLPMIFSNEISKIRFVLLVPANGSSEIS